MKRRLFFVATTLLAATTAFATEQSDTLIVKKPSEVTVVNNDSSCVITIQGKEGNPEFSYRQIIPLSKNAATLINESDTEWDFNMSFYNTRIKDSKEEKPKWQNKVQKLELNVGLFGMGFVNSVNTPHNMHTEMFESYEFLGPRLMWMYRPRMSRFRFGFGVGTNWKNFRMTEKVRFNRNSNGDVTLTPYPEGAKADFSRVKVFSWTIPLEVGFDLTKRVRLSASSIVNFNTYASLKTRYTDSEGHDIKEMDKHLHKNPVTVDFMGHLEFGLIGWYVKYSPCNVFESNRGPQFNAWSTGITLGW